jgi:EmrB/QacA subfamily drug resistance transporter
MAAVAMGILLATIDGSIVNVALPTLTKSYSTDFATVEWVVLAYLLTLATLLLSMGRLADIVGKKRVYATGFVIFTAASAMCGLAPSIGWLVGARVLQAAGAAMILALGPAIVTEIFPPTERGRALGITGTMVSLGVILGPTIGGLLIQHLTWHWIFFVNIPVGIIGTILALRFVPARRPAGGQKFDFGGALTIFFGLFALLLGLSLGQRWGFTDPRVLALLGVFALMLALFVFVEQRVAQPMVDLGLFRNRLFSVNLLTGFMTFFAMAGTMLLMPFYLQGILGYDTQQVGLLMATVPIAMGIMAPLSGTLSDRIGTRPMTVAGLMLLVAGFLAISTLSMTTTALGYILRFVPVGLGMGVFQSPNNSAIMGAAPRDRLGVVSGMLALTRTVGQTTGIALLGAMWANRTFLMAGQTYPGGATAASAAAQVGGLQDVLLGLALWLTAGLGLATWALMESRRQAREALPAA